jgi:hypothetical protein
MLILAGVSLIHVGVIPAAVAVNNMTLIPGIGSLKAQSRLLFIPAIRKND